MFRLTEVAVMRINTRYAPVIRRLSKTTPAKGVAETDSGILRNSYVQMFSGSTCWHRVTMQFGGAAVSAPPVIDSTLRVFESGRFRGRNNSFTALRIRSLLLSSTFLERYS